MSKRHLIAVGMLVFVAALLITAFPAQAITNGTPDGNDHPNVGLIILDQGGSPAWRCTGTLVSPTVVLTAGHCTYGADGARIWFDTDLNGNAEYPFGGSTSYEGTPVTYPVYAQGGFPNTGDVGVIVLDEPVVGIAPAQIAPLGYLDSLATRQGQQDVIFTVVGYGVQEIRPFYQADRIRYQGTSRLVNLRSSLAGGYNLHTGSDNGRGQGTGGTCFGDSGGPVFHGDSNVIVAVTSFGLNSNCKGADFGYRVDIADSQNWVNGFLN